MKFQNVFIKIKVNFQNIYYGREIIQSSFYNLINLFSFPLIDGSDKYLFF